MQSTEILIVEDDTDIRESLCDFLSFEGFSVASAANGKEALDYLAENPQGHPSLIFLDLMMPVMDGHTFLENLRLSQPDCKTPVIILSAVAQAKEDHQNVVSFLKKPVDLEEIIIHVKRFKQ